MRAVNLIPNELRPGGGGGAGRTGGAVYIIVAGLAALVAMAGAYALYSHRIDDRTTKIAEVQREATVAQARAAALQPYVTVRQIRQQRTSFVSGLAGSRFNWGLAVKQLAEALPTDANLCNVQASVTSASSPPQIGCGIQTGSVRGQVGNAPAFEIGGCAQSHLGVAHVIGALRRIPGTTVVGFEQSTDSGGPSSSGGAAGAGGSPTCSGPHYEVVVFFTNTPTRGSATPTVATVPAAAGAAGAPGAGSAATLPTGTATRVTSTGATR